MHTRLIEKFRQYKVLVIGDLMLDVYLNGACNRLSPEAPVPVVDVLSRTISLGGAANTASNLRGLGAGVTFCSVSGRDADGKKAIGLLEEKGIECRILNDEDRETIVKTRVMSGTQLLVRYDSGSEYPVSKATEAVIIELLQEQYALHDAIVIADYNKGTMTPAIISALENLNLCSDKFIVIDSKRLKDFKKLSPSVVKPNYRELTQLIQVPALHTGRVKQVNELGEKIFSATGAMVSVVTLDEEGAIIFEGNQQVYRSHAHQVPVCHVAGAGDAYISAFTLAMMAGAEMSVAAELSAAAAAVAISKKATAHCTWQELDVYTAAREKFITDEQQLEYICAVHKAQGKKIVFTNGCFDILHNGHVNYLNRARELGHILIVGINTDDSIRRLKGRNRPINNLEERMEVLAGLAAINYIIPFGNEIDDTASSLIKLIKPDIYTKGGDYQKDDLPEGVYVEAVGGEITILPLLPDRSTTLIVNRINNVYG